MPQPGDALEKLSFLTIGLFDRENPGAGHQSTLEMISLGERLGFDSAWLRHRHLQYGISSPVAVLAAAAQRTSRIELGTAVTPLGWENPLRLAEDLATVDVLSGGRLNPGVSVGPPRHWQDVRDALYPGTADAEDFSYERVARLLRFVAGEPAVTFRGTEGFEQYSDRVEPHSPGLRSRMWYGGASLASARWAGEHAMNFLTSSVVRAEETADFATIQVSHIRAFREAHPAGKAARVSQGLVVIPTDSATAAQRARYSAYVEARTPRTTAPAGPERMLFARDLIGSSSEIADALYAHAGFREVTEVAFALPFTFEPDDYVQILTDIAEKLGPALGWQPGQLGSIRRTNLQRQGEPIYDARWLVIISRPPGSKTVPLEFHNAETSGRPGDAVWSRPARAAGGGKPAARPVYQARGPSGPVGPGRRGAARRLSPARRDFSQREFICFIRTKFCTE